VRRNSPWGNSDNTSNHPVTELSPRKLPVPFRQQLRWKRERRKGGRYRGKGWRLPMGNLFVFLVGGRRPSFFPISLRFHAYLGSNAGWIGRGTFRRMESKPNVVIEMAVSGFAPNCHQKISGGFNDTLFHYILLNCVSTITITRVMSKQIFSR